MKNIKAIIFIILGAFFLATVFAFASDNTAYGQLRGGAFGPSSRPGSMPSLSVNKAADSDAYYKSASASDPKKPTFKEKAAKVLGPLKRPLTGAAVGMFIGFLLVGTIAGAMTGGVVGLIILGMAM